MDLNGVGFLGAIIIGGLAGWLAETFMKSNMGLVMNIILGIIGAALLNFVLSILGFYTGSGWIVYLIVGFVGACILIALGRMLRRG
ncbi:MAG: GlsB/YeaQ/YmgE family stress response rane protein [Rhizobium sp.]|nr:GlsB/YeaQ/YmgE family stress response rane protein [Rhizobium sp.]